MKKQLVVAAILSTLLSGAAFAQQTTEGSWMVRARAVHLQSDNGGGTTPALNLSMNNKWMPEVDVSYYFTPNIAAELVLTYPQKHDVRLGGDKVGSLKHLPPTLLAQYHFTNFGAFKPYVGAGVNYTRFSNVKIADGAVTVKKNSFGGARQVGFDYALDKNWSLNFDVKKVYLGTKVTGAGLENAKFKVDPWLVGVGVGYRF